MVLTRIKENIIIPWRTREERKGFKAQRISSLFIELTNQCNFDCDFCAHRFMKREKRHMDFSLACRILDEIAREKIVDRVFPHFVGEPLLYPHLFEFLEKAKEKGIPIELFTNGSLLDEKKIKRLYELNIRRLLLSFQTPDKVSFAFRHAPLSFDEFLRKTESIIENKFIYNSSTEIEIQFLSTCKISPRGSVHSLEALDEVKEAVSIFERFSGHLSKRLHLDHDPLQLRELKDIPFSGERFKILPGVEIYFRHACLWNNPPELLGPGIEVKNRRRGWCKFPFQMLLILAGGEVTSCCMDYDGEIRLGNIKEKSIKDIWFGEKLSRIRKDMKKARLSQKVCQRCQGEISDK